MYCASFGATLDWQISWGSQIALLVDSIWSQRSQTITGISNGESRGDVNTDIVGFPRQGQIDYRSSLLVQQKSLVQLATLSLAAPVRGVIASPFSGIVINPMALWRWEACCWSEHGSCVGAVGWPRGW